MRWYGYLGILLLLLLPWLSSCGGGTGGGTDPLARPEVLSITTFVHAGECYASVEWSHTGSTYYMFYFSQDLGSVFSAEPIIYDKFSVWEGIITPVRFKPFNVGEEYWVAVTDDIGVGSHPRRFVCQ